MRRVLPPLVRTFTTCLSLLTLLPAAALAAWPHDPGTGGVRVDNRTYDSYYPVSCMDGAGGAFTAWTDDVTNFVYLQHTSASGDVLWGGGAGMQLSTYQGFADEVLPDGTGGVICVWHKLVGGNNDLYAQRVNAAGVAQWAAGGVVLCNAANDQYGAVLLPDGANGAFVAWIDARANASVFHTYVQHLASNGTSAWTANGVAVSSTAPAQTGPNLASDGAGGILVSWSDARGANLVPYVQRLNGAGAAQWTANGVALTSGLTADQFHPAMISDGRGGAIVAWYDWRTGNSDVYAQRINAAGAVQWTANGVDLAATSGDQTNPAIVGDGASGAIVAWQDGRGANQDVYAQHVSAQGSLQWGSTGVALSTAAGNQNSVQIGSDGAGGAVVAWLDNRNGADNDIYAQRVTASGTVKWTADGVPVCTLPGDQGSLGLAPDSLGGAIISYQGSLLTGLTYAYNSYVDCYGILGGAPPSIVSVRDVPNDQGGYVSIRWAPSWLDQVPSDPIQYYWIYRQVPQAAAEAALRSGAHLLAAGEGPRAGERALRAAVQGTQTYYWEQVVSWGAQGLDGYSAVVATRGDSVAGSNPRTVFMVEARYAGVPGECWDSAPDSGYSVDNLAPVAPSPFTGSYRAGTTAMQWGANPEPDVATYRLYRGPSPGFVPAAGNLLATSASTGYVDSPGAPYVYKLSAVDVHGNEGPCATLIPAGTTGVGPAGAPELALAPPAPNPALARAAVSFTLPRSGPATLALYDAAGRRVRSLASGDFEPGEHHVTIELRDGGGRLAAGVYLLRLEVPGRTLTRTLSVVR